MTPPPDFAALLTNERRKNDSGQSAFHANIVSSDIPKIPRYLLQLRHISVIKGFDQISVNFLSN